MKIEFVKETKANGDTIFYTEIDGTYIDSSVSTIETTGRKYFKMICASQGATEKIILETFEL